MANNITDVYLDYSTGRLVYTLETPFVGTVNSNVTVIGTVASAVEYNVVDAMSATSTGPTFDYNKGAIFYHDAQDN